MTGSPEYITWSGMHMRCGNPKNISYRYYGGKGVKVCERWNSFENFYADMGPRPEGMTLDRIDPAKDYEPGNCRWATPAQQNRNSSIAKHITIGDRTQCIADWLSEAGVARSTYNQRIRFNWSQVSALTTPPDKSRIPFSRRPSA
jgi:hypothetical protein